MRIVLGLPEGRRRNGDLDGSGRTCVAASDLGLHARGARPLPADAGPRAARLLRLALRRPPERGARGGPRLAGSVPDRRVRRPQGREPVQGQPAEGPVHRDDPPRPRRAAHGRAVRRARPGQRRAAQGGLPRDARPGQDARLQHPPARAGRGAVRLGGDHRPRTDRHRRARPARSSARPVTRSSGSRRPATATSPGSGRCPTSP